MILKSQLWMNSGENKSQREFSWIKLKVCLPRGFQGPLLFTE